MLAAVVLIYDLLMTPMQFFNMPDYTFTKVSAAAVMFYWTFDIFRGAKVANSRPLLAIPGIVQEPN